jgi:hypothetical protein
VESLDDVAPLLRSQVCGCAEVVARGERASPAADDDDADAVAVSGSSDRRSEPWQVGWREGVQYACSLENNPGDGVFYREVELEFHHSGSSPA